MRTLWVTGANGVVGTLVVRQALEQGRFDRIRAFRHGDNMSAAPSALASAPAAQWAVLDIGDRTAVHAAAEEAPPNVILNPAAMTNVDACEARREEAWRANGEGPRWLAEVATERGAHLLHVSTDYVFPGDEAQPGPYREDAPPRPVNAYGESKLAGERAIEETCAGRVPFLIARTAIVYGLVPGTRSNFVTWLVSELRAGRRVRVVRDQYNTPTPADDLATLLLWLAERGASGIYHAAGPDRLGRHDWALAIAEHFGLDATLIDWVTSAELAQPARRPLASGLTCDRLAADVDRGAPAPRGIAASLREMAWLAAPR